MNTETTQTTVSAASRDWVCYDGECRLCVAWARRVESMLGRHRFALVPLQAPAVRERLALPPDVLVSEMRLLTADGRCFGGADALVHIAQAIWWARPLPALARLPGVMPALRKCYRELARRRHCVGGACAVASRQPWWNWAPLVFLSSGALSLSGTLEPWLFMWVMAFALFAGGKWLTWRRAMGQGLTPTWTRSLGYLLGWPGMDAEAFLGSTSPKRPRAGEWWRALTMTFLGTALIWGLVRIVVAQAELAAGWIGMVGCVLMLHFGLFHLLALAWQRGGVHAVPIMRSPLLAKSLGDFWGRRWNVAFHRLVSDSVFEPLRPRIGRSCALVAVFVLSGLIHELVISLPARGGYGLPTIYFTLQGLALLFERGRIGRRWGLATGWGGRLLAILVTAAPAFWLFHPPFVHEVILPFLRAIHAF